MTLKERYSTVSMTLDPITACLLTYSSANKKGEPFKFKVGDGAVIKGMDVGVTGMAVGGERRITIPARLAYGKKGQPPTVPANSKLVFDLKLIDLK